MSTLVSAFLIQILLCAILFALIFYFMVRNTKLKKAIESETEKLGDNIRN